MKISISVIIPLYNGANTLQKTLESILVQEGTSFEVIIVDDGSKDDSLKNTKKVLAGKNIIYKIISHEDPIGLAASYNEGIKKAKGDFIITVHQDMVLQRNVFDLLTRPFIQEKNVVASISSTEYPWEIWKKYPFWGKCLFDRFVGRKIAMLDGKCTCFSKKALFKVGLFNSVKYHSAGEDGDMGYKLKKIGTVIKTDATVIHLHAMSANFSLWSYIKKHAQLAEAQGAALRNHPLDYFTPVSFAATFFRELLFFGIFIPFCNIGIFMLIGIYMFLYTRHTYMYRFDMRLFMLPFVNIWLLIISLLYSTKGFIQGKQTL